MREGFVSNLQLLVVSSIFAGAAVKIIHDAPRIVAETHVWSTEYKRVHHEEAMAIKTGKMTPVDYIVQLMLGEERFKKEMVDKFKREEAMAEVRVTDEDVANVEGKY